jgi:hypothetical protein
MQYRQCRLTGPAEFCTVIAERRRSRLSVVLCHATESSSTYWVHQIRCYPCLKREAEPACETGRFIKITDAWQSFNKHVIVALTGI